ncbi:MAG: VCBS repeat-containing protein [bacterium]|nr:VCBS repeat-containing protein [bacterium]
MKKLLMLLMVCGVLAARVGAQTYTNMSEAYGIDCQFTPMGFMGGGAAIEDINGDGLPDLLSATGQADTLAVLINTGSGFELDHGATGIVGRGEDQQVLFGDYDNDGDRDLFIAEWGTPNYLYRNNGNGTFTDVTTAAGVGGDSAQSTCAAWFDYDRDGLLDLYVCNYGWDGVGFPPGTDQHNILYRNNGNGTFSNVTAAAGVADADFRRPLAVLAFDFDYDLDADIVIAMDKEQRSTFFRNNGNGTFTDAGAAVGFEPHIDGMGLAIGDVDGDGWLDFSISNGPPGNELYTNNGDGTFSEEAVARGAAAYKESWGSHMFDSDLDGDPDIYIASTGDLNGNANDVLLINDGTGHFTNEAATHGIVENAMSFGAAFGDFDNNGAMDIFVCNSNNPAALYQASAPTHNWLRLRLRGTASNRDGIGATVRVTSGGETQVQHTMAGSSFESSNDPRLLFGIPDGNSPVVSVTWPSGVVDVFNNLSVNGEHLLVEGSVDVGEHNEPSIPSEISLSLYPNPFNSVATIELNISNSMRTLDVGIFNTLGQQVYAFPAQPYSIGSNRLQWFGKSNTGVEVGSGLYVVRIAGDGFSLTRPLHYVR